MSVETHDINAAPAFVFAFARPERTSKPRVAIVAVLDTKPDAKEESNRAFFDDKSRFAICASACTNKIKAILKSHVGLKQVPKMVYWELRVRQLKVMPVKKSHHAIRTR